MTTTETTSLDEIRGRATVDVPTAGNLLGLSRSAAYRAADRGEIPTIRLGRRLVVPVPELRRLIGDLVDQPA